MWRDRWTWLTVALFVTVTATTGCDDDPQDDPCDGVADSCATEGSTQCTGAGGDVEACRENADGCLVWTEEENCTGRQGCDDSGGSPVCACQDECEADGDMSCDGDSIVTCSADSDGCLFEEETTDCSDDGETCDDSSGTPECAAGCSDDCTTVDETSCDGDSIMTCQEGADGCLDLVATSDCSADGGTCDDSTGTPECTVECTDDCTTAGVTSCDGDSIMTCQAGTDGCLDLVATSDCSADGGTCDDSSGTPECTVPCTDDCDTDGATSCDGDSIMTCQAGTDGCLDLVVTTDCTADNYICDDASGTPECVGCGPCDTPGEYCDDTASPPECLMAGTIPEILEGVAADTGWADLEPLTQAALRARADYANSVYRDDFGPDALDAAVDTMLTSPTAEMETNYAAFLSANFGVEAVANSELDENLRILYVLMIFAWQINVANYHGMPALNWDGVSNIEYFMMTDSESIDAYEGLGSDLTDTFDDLRADASLTAEEVAIAEYAMIRARQFKTGSEGYHFGADVLSTAHGMTGNCFDFMLNYADFVYGNIFASDEVFLDQVNAYLFSELIRVWEGSVVAMDMQMAGIADLAYVEMFLGDPAVNRNAELYLHLVELFYDRFMAHPNIDEPCYLYSDAEQARIWDAFTADSYDNNDGTTSFDSINADFLVYAADEIAAFKAVMTDALIELFPADGAAMTVVERDAIIAAIDATAHLGEVRAAFEDGLAAAGDGTAPDELAAAMAACTIIGGRDYADPDDGATWLAEDEAVIQAMWDEVRDWVLAEYTFPASDIPVDLTVIAGTDGYIVEGDRIYPAGRPRSLRETYRTMLSGANELVSLANGLNIIGPTVNGLSLNTSGGVLDRFLAETLTGAEAANLPFYRLDGLDRQSRLLGGNDVTLRRFVVDTCDPAGQVEWIRTTLVDQWGVPADMVERVASLSNLGPWFFGPDYDMIAYRGILDYLQGRLDADYGAGTHNVDPFVLQVCDLYSPAQDDTTYDALVACVVP